MVDKAQMGNEMSYGCHWKVLSNAAAGTFGCVCVLDSVVHAKLKLAPTKYTMTASDGRGILVIMQGV